jgi:hypothetical protein
MNKDIKPTQIEKRKTRTYLMTEDEKKLLESNFIDNFYSKKKKRLPNSNAYFIIVNLGNDQYGKKNEKECETIGIKCEGKEEEKVQQSTISYNQIKEAKIEEIENMQTCQHLGENSINHKKNNNLEKLKEEQKCEMSPGKVSKKAGTGATQHYNWQKRVRQSL